MLKKIVLMAGILSAIVVSSALAADAAPWTQAVGHHIFQLDDPALTDHPSIRFTGFVDTDGNGPTVRAQPVIQQCHSGNGCQNDGPGWGAVRFGPVIQAGDASWNFEYPCTGTFKSDWLYRDVVFVTRADHSVVRVVDTTPGGYTKAPCK